MKTLLYTNRSEPKSISVISILLLAAAGDITKLRCMHYIGSIISLLRKIFGISINLLKLINICYYILNIDDTIYYIIQLIVK